MSPLEETAASVYISAMTGSLGALNLLGCLHAARRTDTTTRRPVCPSARLSAENEASVSASRTRPPPGSFGPTAPRSEARFPSDPEAGGRREGSGPHAIFVPSSVHPLRASRAAVRTESAWWCHLSRGPEESRGPGAADVPPGPGGAGSDPPLPSIPPPPPLMSRVPATPGGTKAPASQRITLEKVKGDQESVGVRPGSFCGT